MDRVEARARAGEQLQPRERAVQVVVGADVARTAARRRRDREQPRAAEPRVLAQREADGRDVGAVRLAVGDHEVGRLLAERGERRLGAADGTRRVARGVQPRADLGFGGADEQDTRLAPPHRSRASHRPTRYWDQRASWKMTPSAVLLPRVTVLTPWRMPTR